MTEIEPPSDDLRALFGHERDISDVERVAIRHKLAVSIGAPPAAAATTIATSKLVWVAAAAIAAAVGIWWAVQRNEPASTPPPPMTLEPAPMIAPEPRITETAPEPAVREVPTAPARPAVDGPAQTELLAKAWQALEANAAETLKLVELDAKLHARGPLAEEREALHVLALIGLDRRDEARARATKFIAAYPNSVHRATIERRLQ
jgi:hypothetical protein